MARLKTLSPSSIRPPHGYDLEGRLEALVKSMKKNGWKGQPLILMPKEGRKYQALTGSHRWEAAKRVGIKIPVIILPEEIGEAIREAWKNPTTEIYGERRMMYKNSEKCFLPNILAKICSTWTDIAKFFLAESRASRYFDMTWSGAGWAER